MRPPRGAAAGLFWLALSGVLLELVLTRIFSVTMWYHYAFLAVTVAMAGMTAGALAVRAAPGWFPRGREADRMARGALLGAALTPVALAVHLATPLASEASAAGWLRFAGAVGVMAVPFACAGAAICLALTRFPERTGRLYAADLAGAAAACPAAILLLERVDGPAAVVAAAAAAALAGACFARGAASVPLRRAAGVILVLLVAVGVKQVRSVSAGRPLFAITWVKNAVEGPALYEAWNSHSRIRVAGDLATPVPPTENWGLSRRRPTGLRVRMLGLVIDGSAATPLMGWGGSRDELRLFDWETNGVVHRLRPGSRVVVIGAGGGRDILAALRFRQPAVTALEVNGAVNRAVHGVFGDFTGHLDRRPEVTLVHAEGRSWLARHPGPFDVIQLSLVDTWAATSSGALALAEHSLYTVEAWTLFLSRLAPRGILTVSRYYQARGTPQEMARLVALAAAALAALHVADPRRHIMILREPPPPPGTGDGRSADSGIGTIYVSPSPFSPGDRDRLRAAAAALGFLVPLDPDRADDPRLAALAAGADPGPLGAAAGMALDAPTDDNPYFFFSIRPRELLLTPPWRLDLNSVPQLVYALGLVLALAFLAVVAIPALSAGAFRVQDAARATYFAAIGLAFMGVEIAQLQRLSILLGHPTLALAVVLFGLLLAGAAGSRAAANALNPRRWLGLLLAVLAATAVIAPAVAHAAASAPLAARILAALLLVVPGAALMGGPWPLGAAAVAGAGPRTLAWCWAVNGAASVLGPVAAFLIAMLFGISATFWAAVGCYAVAALAFTRLRA